MRHLRLDRHFFLVVLNDVENVVIRVPAAEVKNGTKLEHFLDEDTASLLRLYVNEYLPILTRHNPSVFLFPGRSGKPKTPQVFRSQMNKFVWDGTRLDFHPHVIRKITTKIYLDHDPAGKEIASRHLGDTEETTSSVYTHAINRAANRKYVDALENRRLVALSSMVRVRRKRRG
jgi:integrase